MQAWKIIAPLAVAAGAAAAAVILLKKKPEAPAQEKKADAPKAVKPAPKAPAGKKAKKVLPVTNPQTGTYSFVSGYQNAATVEVSFTYDADRFGFDIISEDFPIATSDSHAVYVTGEDFAMQMEYAGLFNGQTFEEYQKECAEKYKGFGTVTYGTASGFKYIAGDNICICLPVDAESYLLIYMIKAKGNDDDFTVMPDYPDTCAILGSMQVTRS